MTSSTRAGEPRPIEAVFLDAGGVLVSPDEPRVVDRFAEAGIELDPSLLFAAHYHGMHAVDRARSEPEVFDDYHQAYGQHLGLTADRAEEAVAILRVLWSETGLWCHPLPGAADGLAAIAATGLPIVIVSNADGTVAEVLMRSGLIQVGPGAGIEVAAIIDSGAVGVAKPDPAIFELALAASGTTADRSIHVGDAYEYDVRGARAAGIRPVLVDPLGLRADADCKRINSLIEVVGLLG